MKTSRYSTNIICAPIAYYPDPEIEENDLENDEEIVDLKDIPQDYCMGSFDENTGKDYEEPDYLDNPPMY